MEITLEDKSVGSNQAVGWVMDRRLQVFIVGWKSILRAQFSKVSGIFSTRQLVDFLKNANSSDLIRIPQGY